MAEANQLGEVGNVPQSIKLNAARMLDECKAPVGGRFIYRQFEQQSGEAPYTLELTHEQFEDEALKSCLEAKANSLGVSAEIDLGEEPPDVPELVRKNER